MPHGLLILVYVLVCRRCTLPSHFAVLARLCGLLCGPGGIPSHQLDAAVNNQ